MKNGGHAERKLVLVSMKRIILSPLPLATKESKCVITMRLKLKETGDHAERKQELDFLYRLVIP